MIKETGNLEQDSEIILAIYDPVRDKKASHRNYDVSQMNKRYRSIILLKNRYGDGDIAIGAAYFGECCYWKELPKSDQISDYSQYNTLFPSSSGETVRADSTNNNSCNIQL